MTTDLEQKLERARELYRAGKDEDPVFKELADANYGPIKTLFRQMLDDKDDGVRFRTLSRLMRMEDLSRDDQLLGKAREILLHDPDDLSRTKAALILAHHSRWPDTAIEYAVDHEQEIVTREAAFLAALQLMVNWDFADEHRSAVNAGSIELSMDNARKLVSERPGGGKPSAPRRGATSSNPKKKS